MYIKKLFNIVLFLISLLLFFSIDIFAFQSKFSENPLSANDLNSFMYKPENGYPKIYSGINDLILNDIPVLMKDDVDEYLEDISRKISVKVTGANPNPEIKFKYKKKTSIPKDSKAPNISFDFPNVTLVEFTRFISNLNKKILIGENLLQGNITIKTPKKLTLERLMTVFKAILNSRGLSYIISGKYMQIFQKSDSEVKVYQVNYLKAKDVAKSLSQTFKMSFNVGGQPEQIMINSLDDANCVVVLAPKARQLEIGEAIKKLDWRRRQVLLEIMIVEVTYNNTFGFGITAGAKKGELFGGVGPNIAQTGKGTFYTSGTPAAPPISSYNASPYFGSLYNGSANGVDFFVDLQANESIKKLKILNQPKILTSENQKAQIDVGHQEPIVQAQTNMGVSSGTTPASETSVDWKNIGTKIELTPRVNSKRDVTMDFKLTITSIVDHITVGSFKNYPVIGQRITKNTSTIKDNHTLVIGGILKEEKKTQKYKVPFFGDMPYLGWLFTSFDESVSQTELIMFITPRVIETSEEGNIITNSGIKNTEVYDKTQQEAITKSIKGVRDKSWNTFNLYDYYNNKEYRDSEQTFVPQSWNVSN